MHKIILIIKTVSYILYICMYVCIYIYIYIYIYICMYNTIYKYIYEEGELSKYKCYLNKSDS